MSEGLSLNIPISDHFEKSPMHTPSKVLKTLDLLSVDGMLIPKNCGSPGGKSTCQSSFANSPVNRRYQTQSNEFLRRKSLKSDVYYDHTIYDEFSHINLSIKERRPSTGSNESPPPYTFAPISSTKRIVYTRSSSDNNQIIIAKVLEDGAEEDEIEIIDLDDDEEYLSAFNKANQPKENCYPNCDVNVWLRSCEKEIIDPVDGVVIGEIPTWINGSLLRNGPGSIKVGEETYNHLFDAAALLHRFNISEGKVTYQCKFLKSESYKKNLAANRIVVTEFGTACVPDPCQSIFERFVFIKVLLRKSQNIFLTLLIFQNCIAFQTDGVQF